MNFESLAEIHFAAAAALNVAVAVAADVAADVAVRFKVALHTDKRVENFFSNVWPELPFFARKKPMPIKVNASLSPPSSPSLSLFVQLQKHRPQNEEETPTQAAGSKQQAEGGAAAENRQKW